MDLNVRCNLLSFKIHYRLLVFGVFYIVAKNTIAGDIHVRTVSGPVRGYESKSGSFSVYTFKNIPYAKQPIGGLRFELPKDVDPWNTSQDLNPGDVIYCPQSSSFYTRKSNDGIFGQENCLFLDIYIRKTENLEALPVLIYFHAGRFSYGSKEEYGSDFLLKFNEIVIVIPNYRLGILGFLSNQDSSLPGNLGLWDQRMAMKWISENIEYFGGDPQRITIAGHDAGGASVGFHILSPLSHRYFTAAISGSGTALDPWAMNHTSSESTAMVAKRLKCSSSSKDAVITCLKRCEVYDILEVQTKMRNDKFRPTVDEAAKNPFVPFPPQILYEKGYQKNVSYLVGVTQEEAFVEVYNKFEAAIKTQHLDKIIEHLLHPYLQDQPNFPLIVKAVKYHYLRGVPVPSFDSIKSQMISMMSDFLYYSPLHITLKLHSKKTSNTFMYVLNYKDEDDVQSDAFAFENRKRHLGVSHMGDAIYLFNSTFTNQKFPHNSKTSKMKEILCKMWGNFIQTKSLSSSNWKKYSEKEMNYVEISETTKSKVNYKKGDLELWTILVPDLQNIHNLSTEKPKHKTLDETTNTAWGVAGLAVLLGVLCVALVGVVVVTRRKLTQSSIIPITSHREHIKYSNIG